MAAAVLSRFLSDCVNGTHFKIFIVVSEIVTHRFSHLRTYKLKKFVNLTIIILCFDEFYFHTLSTACITRRTSSLARLRVSARPVRESLPGVKLILTEFFEKFPENIFCYFS